MTCATRPSVHRSGSNPNASGPLRNAWSTASSSAADSRGRRPARPAPPSAAWPPWRQRRYQTLAACADTPKVWATSAWLAPWANMWAASRRRCSRPAKSRPQVPTLIGIADLPVRCPCLHTQHPGPKLHYQPIPRSSFTTLDDLVRNLKEAEASGRFAKKLQTYLKPAVLVVDEVGYLPLARTDANMVFQLVARRYERGSILLTSNKAFSEWGSVFGDDVLASAILDRLLHHCDVISINGPSYRLKDRLKPSDGGGALE